MNTPESTMIPQKPTCMIHPPRGCVNGCVSSKTSKFAQSQNTACLRPFLSVLVRHRPLPSTAPSKPYFVIVQICLFCLTRNH